VVQKREGRVKDRISGPAPYEKNVYAVKTTYCRGKGTGPHRPVKQLPSSGRRKGDQKKYSAELNGL